MEGFRRANHIYYVHYIIALCITLSTLNRVWKCIFMIKHLCFTAAPVINTALSSSAETINVGSSLTLFCTSQNSPPDMFTWQKDNDPTVINSTGITTVELTTASAVFRAEYVMDIVSESSNGVYTCAVTNPIGSDTYNIMVTTVGRYSYKI